MEIRTSSSYPTTTLRNTFFNYSFQVLHGEEIEQAKRLLYKVYHEELGWTPTPDNPSGYRIENGKFEDDLTEACTWIGAFDKKTQKLCSVARLVHGLEVIRYLDDEEKAKLNSFENCCEFNRLATLRYYRKNKLYIILTVFATFVAAKSGYRHMLGGISGDLVKFWKSGDAFRELFTFRYDLEDVPSTLFRIGLQNTEISSFIDLQLFKSSSMGKIDRNRLHRQLQFVDSFKPQSKL